MRALVLTLAAATSPRSKPGDAAAPRLDAAGDPLPAGAIARLGTIRFRHGCAIEAIAFSADGKTVASAANDGSIVLHDTSTGKRLRSFKPETTGTASGSGVVAFAPDDRALTASGGPRSVSVFAVATGKRLGQFHLADRDLGHLAFSQDGKILACGAGGVVHVWDVPAGKEIRRIDTQWASLMTLAMSPDGKTLATAILDDRRATVLSLWDTAGGRRLRRWEAHKGEVYALAFSPDGKRLASSCNGPDSGGKEARLRMWAVPTGERRLDRRPRLAVHPGRHRPGQLCRSPCQWRSVRPTGPLDGVALVKRHGRGRDLDDVLAFCAELLTGAPPEAPWRKRLLSALSPKVKPDANTVRTGIALMVASPEVQLA
jgi:WD40 repeat protein